MRLLVLITLLTASAHAGEWLHLPAGGGDQRQVTSGVVLAPGDALLLRPSEPSGTTSRVLVFESFTTTPPKWFSLRPLRQDGPPLRVVSLPPPGHSEAWTRQRIRVEGLPATWRELRLDFGLPPGGALQIRNLEWRPERPGEFDQTEVRPSSVSDKLIDDELSRNYPASISRVEIRERDVLISGHVENTDSVPLLAEIPMDRLLDDPSRFEVLLPIATETGGAFEIKVPRVRQRSAYSVGGSNGSCGRNGAYQMKNGWSAVT